MKEARDAAEAAYAYDRQNRIEALVDLEFLAGHQWDVRDRTAREADERPVLTVNRLLQPVKQIANDIRFSTPGVTVAPVDKGADEGTATVLAGLFRQIQRQSMASWVYSVACGHAAACGVGHFRLLTDYVDDDVFEQEIHIRLVPNPLAVLWDPKAALPHRGDAGYCHVLEFVPVAEFERRYPGAAKVDFDGGTGPAGGGRSQSLQWFRPDHITIAEYWKVEEKERTIGLLESGQVVDLTNVAALGQGMQVVRKRKVKGRQVTQMIVSGREVLREKQAWAGRYIPVIPIIGNEIPLESTVVRHGIVRHARDAQRMYNYWRSTAAEWIGLSPKSPYLATEDEIGPYKEMWDTLNTKPRPYMLYARDPQNPMLKPTRERPPEPPAALWQEGSITADEIKATTAIYDAGLGQRSNEVSGKAITARQQQGEIANYEYADNLRISLDWTGKVLMDLVPRIYDTQRIVRILDEEEKERFEPVNWVATSVAGGQVLLNDLSAGKYDVTIKMGPSQATRRTEAQTGMVEFLKLNPEAFAAVADIVVEEMEWPGAPKIARRLKRTIPPDILGEDAVDPPKEPDPLQVEGAKQEVRAEAATAAKKEAETRLAHAKADREEVEVILEAMRPKKPNGAARPDGASGPQRS